MGSSLSGTQNVRKSLKRPDQFFQSVSKLFNQLSEHANGFVVVLVVLFALGLVGAYVSNHLDKRSDQAKNALYLADKTMMSELKAIASREAQPAPTPIQKTGLQTKPPAAQEASPESVAFKKFDVDALLPETVKKLKAIEQDFSSNRAAFDARMKLADLYYNHGEATKAVPIYEKSTQTAPDRFEKALAFSALGYAYESLEKNSDAIQAYQKSLDQGEKSLKGDLLMGMARCYEAMHDTAKARSTYDQILTDLPNTEYSKTAELFKAQLQ